MLQRRHLVAQVHVCPGVEIVPLAVPLGDRHTGESGQRLAVHAVADVILGGGVFAALGLLRLLPCVPARPRAPVVLLVGVAGVAVARAAVAGAAVALLRIGACLRRAVFDRVIGGVDVVHLPGGFLISRVEIRMVFLCQIAVGLFDLLVRGVRGHTQYLVGILNH